jgi:hypothetical protein
VIVSNAVKGMADDLVPLEYVCARWAYSELLSSQPYHGSELKPLREKLARGVSFEDLDTIERALLLRKWREVVEFLRLSNDYEVSLLVNWKLGAKNNSETRTSSPISRKTFPAIL